MTDPAIFVTLRNGQALPQDRVPVSLLADFRRAVIDQVKRGRRVAAFFGRAAGEAGELWIVLANPDAGLLQLARTRVEGDSYPALTPDCPPVHWFEREIKEQWNVTPQGHPWLKPIRFERDFRGNGKAPTIGVTDFFRIDGEEVHEVAVGPVHAGIIEPGHFRFQCHGEHVYHLEISLGYQHRGVEPALVGGPNKRTLHYMETLAGDTTIGHAWAYCQAVEALSAASVPARAQVLRGIALELERLANHTGDLGALAGDVGYLPTQAYCGRLRGDFLNLTALVCGNRFGRGLLRPGGVGFDVDAERVGQLRKRLDAALVEVAAAANLLWTTPSVMSRFEETGAVSAQTCNALGLVGPAARACGVANDVRHDFPTGIYRLSHVPVSVGEAGDVFARAYVRWLEIQRSVAFIQDQLEALPDGPLRGPALAERKPGHIAVSLIEGWRGEICHVALTDETGRFARYKVVDPSFHNWIGLALALRGQEISDFPLCNKSFNLSYCGHDL